MFGVEKGSEISLNFSRAIPKNSIFERTGDKNLLNFLIMTNYAIAVSLLVLKMTYEVQTPNETNFYISNDSIFSCFWNLFSTSKFEHSLRSL